MAVRALAAKFKALENPKVLGSVQNPLKVTTKQLRRGNHGLSSEQLRTLANSHRAEKEAALMARIEKLQSMGKSTGGPVGGSKSKKHKRTKKNKKNRKKTYKKMKSKK